MTNDNDIEQKLNELHAAYLGQLPLRLLELDRLWQSFKRGDRSVLPQLTYEVHRLADSGASFGLPHISQQARIMEDLLQTAQLNTAAKSVTQFETALNALRQSNPMRQTE